MLRIYVEKIKQSAMRQLKATDLQNGNIVLFVKKIPLVAT